MHKSQADRSVIAARVEARILHRPVTPRPDLTRAQNPRGGAHVGPVKRTRALPMTAAQRDSRGRLSHWSRSATYFDAVEVDRRWSA